MSDRLLIWLEKAVKEYEDLLGYLWFEWGESVTIRIINEINDAGARIKKIPNNFL